jgi:hypothetical protein
MQIQPTRHLPSQSEAGQAAAVVALLLFFVFLPLAALAIDGGIVFLMRRDLQNVADASALSACIDLAHGGNEATALVTATNTVATNLGTYADYVGDSPPTSNTGTGTSLIKGIEISGVEVRVALQRLAPTVLTQFFGRGQTPVTAQARCGANYGGGVLPVAVQRFDGRNPGATYVDHIAAEGAPLYTTEVPVPVWHNTQYDYDVMVPLPLSQWTASANNPGPVFSLVGQSSETNITPSSMNGMVSLDIRNVAAGAGLLEFYNGVTSGQANAYKDVTSQYLCAHGYPGPFPQIGSQVAQLMGVSANFGPGTIGNCQYHVGDSVVAIVYDGYVWRTPDFQVTLAPNNSLNPNGIANVYPYPNTPASAVQYSLTLGTAGPAAWFNPLSFDLTFFLSEPVLPDLHILLDGNPVTPGTPYRVNNVSQSTGWSKTVAIYMDSASISQTTSYLGGVSLLAESVSLGHTRGDSSQFGFQASSDFAVSTDDAQAFVNQGGSQNINLNTLGVGLNCNNVPVHADIVGGGWGTYFSSSQNTNVKVTNQPQSVNFGLTAITTGLNDTTVTVRFTVGPGSCTTKQHSIDIPVAIKQPLANQATIDNFVIIQGFAVLRIESITSNDVLARAISPLLPDLSTVMVGLRPRLVPWN